METTKAKASADFSANKFSDNGLNIIAGTIAYNLINVPLFIPLATIAAEIKARNDYYGDLLTKISEGNKQMTVIKNNARAGLEEILRSTAPKIQNICNGDMDSILSSGFHVNRKHHQAGILDMPLNVIVKPGKTTGSLDISWNAVAHARIYEIRYTPMPETENSAFLTSTSTRRKFTLENLTPGLTYIIQVAGVGADPKRIWSVQVISCYVS
jgi:hypothetical protein